MRGGVSQEELDELEFERTNLIIECDSKRDKIRAEQIELNATKLEIAGKEIFKHQIERVWAKIIQTKISCGKIITSGQDATYSCVDPNCCGNDWKQLENSFGVINELELRLLRWVNECVLFLKGEIGIRPPPFILHRGLTMDTVITFVS